MRCAARRPGAAAVVAATLAALIPLATVVSRVVAHGVLTKPPQRGILYGGSPFAPDVEAVPGAPWDFKPHFPAGDKSDRLGAGRLSQASVVASQEGGVWTQFTPATPGYVWKAGVCGDALWGEGMGDHLRGGPYYGNATITQTYAAGGTLSMSLYMVAEHGGYTVIHVCDVAKCGGEVSGDCFVNGHCTRLERAPEAEAPGCAAGIRGDCAPVDPAHPDRWYMPCPATLNSPTRLGGDKTAVFRLPPNLTCEHCVLHWYWVAANWCNPPGLADYFKGPAAPSWTDSCRPVQGGYKPLIAPCGTVVPEEYHACADIRIVNNGGSGGDMGPVERVQTPSLETKTVRTLSPEAETVQTPSSNARSNDTPRSEAASPPSSASVGVRLVVEGQEPINVQTGSTDAVVNLTVPIDARLTFQALPPRSMTAGTRVRFLIDGVTVWVDSIVPYYMYGNYGGARRYWPAADVIWDRAFTLEVVAGDARSVARIRLRTE
ncbi:hypothetical protein MMPV_001063 [Pyropia vietnamensis]